MFRSPVLPFYKNFRVAAGAITVVGLWLCFQSQSLLYALVFTFIKVLTNVLIGLLFLVFKKDELIYYNNLGLPSPILFLKVFALDMIIWLTLLVLNFQL